MFFFNEKCFPSTFLKLTCVNFPAFIELKCFVKLIILNVDLTLFQTFNDDFIDVASISLHITKVVSKKISQEN